MVSISWASIPVSLKARETTFNVEALYPAKEKSSGRAEYRLQAHEATC